MLYATVQPHQTKPSSVLLIPRLLYMHAMVCTGTNVFPPPPPLPIFPSPPTLYIRTHTSIYIRAHIYAQTRHIRVCCNNKAWYEGNILQLFPIAGVHNPISNPHHAMSGCLAMH